MLVILFVTVVPAKQHEIASIEYIMRRRMIMTGVTVMTGGLEMTVQSIGDFVTACVCIVTDHMHVIDIRV